MGVTVTMVEILYEPYNLSLSPVGTTLASGDDFGSLEGYKLSTDLTSPVSGTLVQINNFLIAQSGQGAVIFPTNDDPNDAYNSGWLVVIQLSKPSELNALLTPQSYRALVATTD
jgi:glycine cleavage system H protein